MISLRKYPNFIADNIKISNIAVQNETDDVVVRKTDDASVQTEPVDVALPAEVNDIAVETDAVSTSDMALQTDATDLVDVSIMTDLIYLQIHSYWALSSFIKIKSQPFVLQKIGETVKTVALQTDDIEFADVSKMTDIVYPHSTHKNHKC